MQIISTLPELNRQVLLFTVRFLQVRCHGLSDINLHVAAAGGPAREPGAHQDESGQPRAGVGPELPAMPVQRPNGHLPKVGLSHSSLRFHHALFSTKKEMLFVRNLILTLNTDEVADLL